MGKKRKESAEPKGSRRKRINWIAVTVMVLIVGSLTWGWVNTRSLGRQPSNQLTASSGYVRRETRVPLSPVLFVGQTARAYQVANEIPEVLDQLYCYCQCDKHLGHKSLLSCFTDTHGAT